MGVLDWVLIAAIAVIFVLAVFFAVKNRRKSRCCGDCSSCGICGKQ